MAISLKAKKRDNLSRGATKQIRSEGYIPSVVYGEKEEARTVSVHNMELLKTLRDEGRNAIISLEIEDGTTVDVMLHEYQTDPVKGDVIHADFYVIDLTAELDVTVSLRLEGEPAGAREGGILQQPLYELQVRAKPRSIPEEIVADVSQLDIGDSLSVGDLPEAEDYEYLDEIETTIAVVLAPETEEEEVDVDVDPSVEPELVGAEDDEEDVEEEE